MVKGYFADAILSLGDEGFVGFEADAGLPVDLIGFPVGDIQLTPGGFRVWRQLMPLLVELHQIDKIIVEIVIIGTILLIIPEHI